MKTVQYSVVILLVLRLQMGELNGVQNV